MKHLHPSWLVRRRPPLDTELARIEQLILRCEAQIERLARCGHAPSDQLMAMSDRLVKARQQIGRFRRPAEEKTVVDARRMLARWSGNLDPVPEPRRAPRPFDEGR